MTKTIAARAYNTALQVLIADGCKNLKYFRPVKEEVPESRGRLLISDAEGTKAAADGSLGILSVNVGMLHLKAMPAYIRAAAAAMGLEV